MDIGLRKAKEKMAPKREAPKVQPIFKPKKVFEAAIVTTKSVIFSYFRDLSVN